MSIHHNEYLDLLKNNRIWAAEKLKTSERTLRRRLSEENTSYQAILDEVRLELAREYLLETALPLHEIAALLGFSEPGNFTHTFKRWVGVTPNIFRKQKGGEQYPLTSS